MPPAQCKINQADCPCENALYLLYFRFLLPLSFHLFSGPGAGDKLARLVARPCRHETARPCKACAQLKSVLPIKCCAGVNLIEMQIRTSGSVTVNASNPKSGTSNPNDIPSPVSAMSSNTLDSEINYGGAFWQMIQKFADEVTDYSIKHNIFLEDTQKLVSRWYSHSVFAKRQALTLNR